MQNRLFCANPIFLKGFHKSFVVKCPGAYCDSNIFIGIMAVFFFFKYNKIHFSAPTPPTFLKGF